MSTPDGTPSSALAAPRRLRMATLHLAGAQAVVSATLPLNATVGSVAAVHLSHHHALGGASVGVALLASMTALMVAGRQSDVRGRRPVLATGLALMAAGAVVAGIGIGLGSFAVFIAGTAIFGLGSGPSMLCRAAAADLYPTALRGRGVGIVTSAGTVGAVFGPMLAAGMGAAGVALGVDRETAPWFVVPVLGAIAIYLVLTIRPDPRDVARDLRRWYPALPPAEPDPPARQRRELVALPPVRAAIVCIAGAQGAMVGVMAVTGVVLDDAGHGQAAIAALMSAHFIGMFAFSIPLGGLADRRGRRVALAGGAVVTAAGALGTGLIGDSIAITPFFFLLGLGWCACFVASTSVLADVTTATERGRLMALNDQVVALAGASAALGCGPLLGFVGFWAVGGLMAVVTLLPLLLVLPLREPAPGRYGAVPPSGGLSALASSRR